MKECFGCKTEKPFDDFYRNKNSADGRQPRCKVCMREPYNTSRRKNVDHYRQVARERKANKTEQWRKWKSERGCQFCSETFAPCLHLHHLVSEDKEAALADMLQSDASWERIMNEAAKGIIVCGNCHTKVHYGILTIGV